MLIGELVWKVRLPNGSGMSREAHVPFYERPRGRFPRPTHHSLHWVLDVSFNEDDINISEGNAAANLAVLRSMSLSLLKNSKHKVSVKAKRKRAGWDTDFLEEVLLSSNF